MRTFSFCNKESAVEVSEMGYIWVKKHIEELTNLNFILNNLQNT